MLDVIRKQDRELQLHKQLLEKVIPLLRRDCNYYNIDKIKTESKFNEETEEWILPKVITSSTNLTTVQSKTSLTAGLSPRVLKKSSAIEDVRPGSPSGKWSNDDQSLSKILTKPDANMEYFKSKRAKELLAECSVIKGSPSIEKHTIHGSGGGMNKSPSHSTNQNGGNTTTGIFDVSVKPRKLDSISHYKSNYQMFFVLVYK